jgi:hypothetical protein
MESAAAGELVKVSTGGPPADGIVFDLPSARKVVVAVSDRARGPVLRTVPPQECSPLPVVSRVCHPCFSKTRR